MVCIESYDLTEYLRKITVCSSTVTDPIETEEVLGTKCKQGNIKVAKILESADERIHRLKWRG